MSRLTPERLDELYRGTLRLVADHGFDNLTMDHVAEATHSSKATLYRQWGSKVALVVDALKCTGDLADDGPDAGSLRGDLEEIVARKGGGLAGTPELITAIMHAMKQDEELAEAVRAQMIEPGRERIRTMLQRAVDRGEVAADCPALPFADIVLMAPMILGSVLDGADMTPGHLDDYFQGVLLPALGVH